MEIHRSDSAQRRELEIHNMPTAMECVVLKGRKPAQRREMDMPTVAKECVVKKRSDTAHRRVLEIHNMPTVAVVCAQTSNALAKIMHYKDLQNATAQRKGKEKRRHSK